MNSLFQAKTRSVLNKNDLTMPKTTPKMPKKKFCVFLVKSTIKRHNYDGDDDIIGRETRRGFFEYEMMEQYNYFVFMPNQEYCLLENMFLSSDGMCSQGARLG